MKRIIIIFLALAMIIASTFTFVACNGSADFVVGICQLAPHAALDAATQGFIDALTQEMEKAGKTVKFDNQNAQDDTAICSTIINKFVSQNVDLIFANATKALQSAANATLTIPILGTSITNYSVALAMSDTSAKATGRNISGTSDLAPLDKQAEMLLALFPNAKKVGLVFCSSEANSRFQIDEIKRHLATLNPEIECKEYKFADSNEISAVVTLAASESDVIYVPTDNTAATNASIIDNICSQKNVPVIAGEESICSLCGVATLSISYYNIGVETGKMAAEILLNGADISKMEIRYDVNPQYKYDANRLAKFNVTAPSNYTEI